MNTALQRLPLLGIVIVATGCDNVEWGGVELGLRSPSDSTVSEASAEVEEVVENPVLDNPAMGPVLYLGHRAGGEAILVAVAEIRPDGLSLLEGVGSVEASRSFMVEHLTPGLEFTLFSDGARVGRLTAERFSVDGRYCSARPQIRGPIELTPAAATVQRFLALPRREASAFEYGAYAPVVPTRDLRVTSLTTMQQVIPAVGALLARIGARHPAGRPDVSGPVRRGADRGRNLRIRRRSRRGAGGRWSLLRLPRLRRRRDGVQGHICGLPVVLT